MKGVRSSRFLIIVLIIIAVVLEIAISHSVYYGTISSDVGSILITAPSELAWTVIAIGILFLFMDTKTFEDVYNRKNVRKSNISFIAVATLVILLCITVVNRETLFYFGNATVLIMLVGFLGGYRISIPVGVITCIFAEIVVPTNLNIFHIVFFINIISMSIVSGLVSRKRYPGIKIGCIIITIVGIAYLILSFVLLKTLNDTSMEVNFKLLLISTVMSIISSIISLLMLKVLLRTRNDKMEKKRRDDELHLAHDIQMTSLQQSFPNSHSMDIHAFMEPAIEIGGDFYDCIKISKNLTLFVVADVSDKGLPASLLMMRSLGIIRTAAMIDKTPGSILTAFNNELCVNNPSNQFVTTWLGIYDSDTGVLCHSNAGHTPVYIQRKNGTFEKLPSKKGLAIGIMNNVRYKTSVDQMYDGDILFAYTDGVNEAFNMNDEEFGHKRLIESLNDSDHSSSKSIIESVWKDVTEFIHPNERSDDITMLCVSIDRSRYHTMTVPGKVDYLDQLNEFIEGIYLGAGFPIKDVRKMEIVCEEIFVNICDHAYNGKEGNVTMYCACLENEMKLSFCDNAPYFNPINKEDIEIDEDVNKWPIGGFGIHMVKNLVSYMDYKYFAGMNIFTVWKIVDGKTDAALPHENLH